MDSEYAALVKSYIDLLNLLGMITHVVSEELRRIKDESQKSP